MLGAAFEGARFLASAWLAHLLYYAHTPSLAQQNLLTCVPPAPPA